MPRALGSTSNNTENIPRGGSHSLPSTSSVQQNLLYSLLKDNEAALFETNSDQRYTLFRFDSIGNDAPLRINVVPFPVLLPRANPTDRSVTGSESNINMDKHDKVSSTIATSLQANPQRDLGSSHLPDHTCSGSNVSGRQRKRGGRRNKVVEDLSDLSDWIPNSCITSSSVDQEKDVNETDKARKRNSKKKGKKKKKKQHKKSSSDNKSTELDLSHAEVYGSVVSKTYTRSDLVNKEPIPQSELAVNAMPSSVLLQDKTADETTDEANGSRFSNSVGNLPRSIRKENNNSPRQKTQKDDVGDCTSKSAECVGLQFDCVPKEAPSSTKTSNVVGSNDLVNPNDDSKQKVMVFENKNKTSKAGKKKEFNHSRKGTHANKTDSAKPTKLKMQEKEALEVSTQVIQQNRFNNALSQTSNKNFNASEPVQSSRICEDERKAVPSVCHTVSDRNSKTINIPPPVLASEVVDRTHLLGVQSQKELHLLVSDTSTKKEGEVSRSVRKWIPVARKDASREIHTTRSNRVLVSYPEVSNGKALNLKNIGEKPLNPNAHSFVPLKNVGVASVGLTSAVIIGPPPKGGSHVEKFITKNSFITGEQSSKPARILEIHSNKIIQAVSEAYRVEIASIGAHLATGSPLADFETLLHSASPVLMQTGRLQDCRSCSRNRFVDASLCRLEIPNISLGSLWQWYEKSGSYGLEVKAEDHLNSRRMSIKPCRYSAYFVPLLSAVQLFRTSKRHLNCSRGYPNVEMLKTYGNKKESVKFSDSTPLPIGSILFPQLRGMNKTSSTLDTITVSGKAKFSDRSLSAAQIDDSELLFEYFESEIPYHRQPLFDKIKDLVKGNGLQNGQAYGDPKMLVSMNLQDLHPASWYSVAWYPIYGIPEGKLQAAFLTYHSLGHFVRRRTLSSFSGGGTNIVSPVVGLQSYKAQHECWLQLRPSLVNRNEETYKLNRAEILKERLRSLEKTACVMARTIIGRGIDITVNKQPDYEYFVSWNS